MNEAVVGLQLINNNLGAPAAHVNGQNPAVMHREVIEMFPDHDLTAIIKQFGHMNSEELAALIVDRIAQIPKKQGTKRKFPESQTPDHNETESFSSDEADEDMDHSGLLVDKMISDLLRIIKSELSKSSDRGNSILIKNFLVDKFTGIRCEFMIKILSHFQNKIVAAAIACFFVENSLGLKMIKVIPQLNQPAWAKSMILLQNRRSPKYPADHFWPEFIPNEFDRYTQLMSKFKQGEYSALLTSELKLSPQYNQIKWDRPVPVPETSIECMVCLEKFKISRMVFCNTPVMPKDSFFATTNSHSSTSTSLTISSTHDELMPGPSNKIQKKINDVQTTIKSLGQAMMVSAEKFFVPTNNPIPVITLGDDEENPLDSHTHAFCRGCIRGQAEAATSEVPLADGGVGLRCMAPNCKNPILFYEIIELLKRDVRKKLEERIVEENLGMASIPNLERCRRCNFALQMEVDKHVDKVFDCLKCGAKFCRLCERAWDDDHFGISCEELDAKMQKDKKLRDLEKQLNEAVIRKCPRCNISFMKEMGCNKMTCRCGMTQCYICRQSGIGYDHFCQHFRDPKITNFKCDQCTKKCLLYEDANKKDNQLLQEIRQKDAEKAGPSTSANQVDPRLARGRTIGNGAVMQNPPLLPNAQPPVQAQQQFMPQIHGWAAAGMPHQMNMPIQGQAYPQPLQMNLNQPQINQQARHGTPHPPGPRPYYQQPFVGFFLNGAAYGDNGYNMPLPNFANQLQLQIQGNNQPPAQFPQNPGAPAPGFPVPQPIAGPNIPGNVPAPHHPPAVHPQHQELDVIIDNHIQQFEQNANGLHEVVDIELHEILDLANIPMPPPQQN